MSDSASKLALRISRRLSQHAFRNLLPLEAEAGVVSFTFDDAPASACEAGAHALEHNGVRGTFYVAGGLTGGMEEGKPCHSREHLQTLLANGHELGCHSYSHIRCDNLSADALEAELDRNAAFLAELGVDIGALNFAYPFGAYAYNAKRICSRRFRSSRVTGGGTHEHVADLNALKTHRLYDLPVDAENYETLLQRTARNKGWLIVNTHDVESPPSRFGYTPDRLEHAIAAALAAGCKVLPVNAAIDYWESNSKLNSRQR
ncbi:chitin deacetylase [Herbaspirillum sp. meg3]|uniref:polysaccharide deacetylase family protein n=1 Tax=Herbaspirillum sp. meg3 TaxID=2025949 RepID=UPI000B97CE8D|nr:polysaccharide deacetylase family protein [Herbaspirillum sp. meg3]ASU38211.1 chitin deacetylase [Herbaspirillum sp. meg3]